MHLHANLMPAFHPSLSRAFLHRRLLVSVHGTSPTGLTNEVVHTLWQVGAR